MTSRSDLKREYKERPVRAGVFLITNRANGKVYLGSSTNLHGPLNKHRFMLSIGSHDNKQMQSDYRRDGASSFTFEIAEVVEPSDDEDFRVEDALAAMEERWMSKTECFDGRGYNTDRRIRQ
jgi:group I intron endonuclease